jgi:hypothetical protein
MAMSKGVRLRRRGCSSSTAACLIVLCAIACGDGNEPLNGRSDSSTLFDAAQDDAAPDRDAGPDSSTHPLDDGSIPAEDAGHGRLDAMTDDASGPISTSLLDDVWLMHAPPSCERADDCESPSSCVHPSPSSAGICAPTCGSDEDCDSSELCFEGYGGGDSSCFAIVGQQEACGIPFAQLCDSGLTCFPLSVEGRSGACFATCAPELASPQCPIGSACLGGWIDSDGNSLGICGAAIRLGERCDEPFGAQLRCEAGLTCSPDADPEANAATQWHCRATCDSLRACAKGACRTFGRVDGKDALACYE